MDCWHEDDTILPRKFGGDLAVWLQILLLLFKKSAEETLKIQYDRPRRSKDI